MSPHVFVVRDGRVVRVEVTVIARDADRLGITVNASGGLAATAATALDTL